MFCFLRYFCNRKHTEEDLWDWTEIWQKYVLNSVPDSGFPSQNDFSGRCAAANYLFIYLFSIFQCRHNSSSYCFLSLPHCLQGGTCKSHCAKVHQLLGHWSCTWGLLIFGHFHSCHKPWCHARAGWEMHSLSDKSGCFSYLYWSSGLSSNCSILQKQRFLCWQFFQNLEMQLNIIFFKKI